MAIPDTPFHKKIRSDFKVFVYYIHQHLGLPDPTPVQLNMTDYLQHGPKRSIIQAFRGVGKSHLTAGYVVWRLLKDPETKILVVSASKERADAFSTFCQRLIWELEGLEYLKPRSEQRQSKISFDVGPSTASQSPSVKSVGITSQITGSRADLIVADDIEVLNNSGTQQMRDKLAETIKEFDAVLKPLPTSRVVFLGTPQTEDSLYAKLPERGYECRIWPARMPKEEEIDKYGESLAPFIKGLDLAPSAPTDPLRFQEEDLLEREASYGKAGFAMQFMLSTQLSDMERFPLKVRDLIVMSVDNEQGPLRLTWGPLEDRALNDLPNAAMRGDRMYPPMNVGDVVTDFSACVMSIDPSGRGADETGYAVVKMLNGFLYVVACGGLSGGYDDTTLTELSHIAKKFKVNEIVVESNFGDGMFIKVLQPVTAQKYEQAVRFHKMLIYQMTRITTDKGSLKHDDRLDALSMAVGYYVEQMNRDEVAGESAHKQDLLDKELEKFIDNVDNPSKVSKPILSEGPIMFTEFR